MTPFGLPGLATLAGIIGCASASASAYICRLGLLGTRRSLLLRRRGGSLRLVWALFPGYSLRDPPLVGTRRGSGS
jgi:hypothetical protein